MTAGTSSRCARRCASRSRRGCARTDLVRPARSGVCVLEALPATAAAGLALQWIDPQGAVTGASGESGGAQILADAESLQCEVPSGRRWLAFRLGEQRAVISYDAGHAGRVEPLLQGLQRLLDDHRRLEQD